MSAFQRMSDPSDRWAEQSPKTCQPECSCGCHALAGDACGECGGPDPDARVAEGQRFRLNEGRPEPL